MRGHSAWRDLAIASLIAALAAVVATLIDFHESLFAFTRRWERLQLDELPVAIFVFVVSMVVLYWKRVAELRRALGENRRLAKQALQLQEAERKHLARELHDELGQYLNAIKLDSLTISAENPAAPVAETAQRVARTADHVYGVVSLMIRRLRPSGLDELGLVAALESCIGHWRASRPDMTIRLVTFGALDEMNESVNLDLYRLVQEGLTNCVKHSGATEVEVVLQRQADADGHDVVVLEVRDNGRGLAAGEAPATGQGLRGMRERVDMQGGHFEVLSQPGSGVTIRAEIPLRGAAR